MIERVRRYTRREVLVGAAKVGAGMAATGVAGFWLGGETKRVELSHSADLPSDLLAKLKSGGHTLIIRPNGKTVEAMRKAKVSISDFPLRGEQARIEQAVSPYGWMAVNPLKLPLGKGGESFAALEKLVTSESLAQQKRLGSDIEVVSGEVIDWVQLDHEHQLRTGGEDLISEGLIIMTGTKIGDNVVGISRDVRGGPLEFRVIDASAPPPDGLRAAGIVVAK